MAYLTDSQHTRAIGNLPAESGSTDKFPDTELTPHMSDASDELKDWVGDAAYATALADIAAVRAALVAPATVISESSLLKASRKLRVAEACLCIAKLLPSLNLSTSGRGIMAGVSSPNGGDVRMRNPGEIAQMVKEWRRRAADNARAYLVTGGSLSIGVSYARDEAGEREV